MIFGIDSYFKGINIAFISGKQLYKYAEGLENNIHQLKQRKPECTVPTEDKFHTFDAGIWHTLEVRREDIQATVLTPLLIQFWLWEEVGFRVLGNA